MPLDKNRVAKKGFLRIPRFPEEKMILNKTLPDCFLYLIGLDSISKFLDMISKISKSLIFYFFEVVIFFGKILTLDEKTSSQEKIMNALAL